MKKILLTVLAVIAAFAVISCNSDPEPQKQPSTPSEEPSANPSEEPSTPSDEPSTEPSDEPAADVKLCINEVNGVKGYKGIEIYNAGDAEVDLEGWVVKKNDEVTDEAAGTTLYWEGKEGVGKIAAKGYYVIHANKDDGNLPEKTEGCVATGGLSNKKGVKLELINPAGETVDTFNRGFDTTQDDPEVPLDELTGSFARETDGADSWKLMEPTFGATNNGAALVGDGVITGM